MLRTTAIRKIFNNIKIARNSLTTEGILSKKGSEYNFSDSNLKQINNSLNNISDKTLEELKQINSHLDKLNYYNGINEFNQNNILDILDNIHRLLQFNTVIFVISIFYFA